MPLIFRTPQGHARIKQILGTHRIQPHTYQLDGIAASLDGEDVIATMATGAGKTGFYTFLMIVILAIAPRVGRTLSAGLYQSYLGSEI